MGNYGFRRPNDSDLGVNGVEISSRELLRQLIDDWKFNGKREDIRDAGKILSLLKSGKKAEKSFYADSLFGTTDNINDLHNDVFFGDAIDDSLGFHVDISGGHTTRRLGNRDEFDYQYRISINNDSSVTHSDIILFTSKFEELCKKKGLPLNIKVIPDERDVFICYCKDDNISSYVQILIDMKDIDKVSAITKKFGCKKPFTSSFGNNSYFGISSGLFKNEASSRILGTIPVGDTMTSYSARLAENAYNILLKKYNGDIGKIMVEEFYIEMHKEHVRRQFPDRVQKGGLFRREKIPSELLDIPFWMNDHAYNMVYSNNLDRGTRGR